MRRGFTLIELLIVVGILAVLSTVSVLALNPVETFRQARDARRLADLRALQSAVGLIAASTSYDKDGPNYSNSCVGEANQRIFVSVPSDQESPPTPPAGWTYQQVTSANLYNVNGSGWMPVNLEQQTGFTDSSPIASLPIDPINTFADGYYYTYACGSYEFTAQFESERYRTSYASADGGNSTSEIEVGSSLTLTPARQTGGEEIPPEEEQTPTLAVTDATPSVAVVGDSVSGVTITGTGFLSGATVKLTKANSPDITGTGFVFSSATSLTGGSFDLTGADTGLYTLTVTNPGGQYATLANAFTVNEGSGPAEGTLASSVTHNGITWTFDSPRQVGQFITGDYWVIGPVTITSVSPGWDGNMNGSMVNPDPGLHYQGSPYAGEKQGYDARAYGSYASDLRTTFPTTLQAGDSLVSTIGANPTYQDGRSFIYDAAFLSVLDSAPFADAFPPSYFAHTGTKPMYRMSQVNRSLLPGLAMPGGGVTVDTASMANWLRGPRLGHLWVHSYQWISPSWAGMVYSRDSASIIGQAMTALMLANPDEQLLIRILQRGLENYFMFKRNPDIFPTAGGHSNGNKGPMVMAGILFGDTDMATLNISSNEDGQTYYAAPGQHAWFDPEVTALWSENHGVIGDFEEKDPLTWTVDGRGQPGDPPAGMNSDARSMSYKMCCTVYTWIGEALAIKLLHGEDEWDHPAFFDVVDVWMSTVYSEDELSRLNSLGTPYSSTAGTSASAFVSAMWNAYRSTLLPAGKGYPSYPEPVTPGNFTAGATVGLSVNLAWSDVSYENNYVLERSLSSSSGFATIATLSPDVLSYSDQGLSGATTYYYRLKATNSTGSSPYTSVISATTPTAASGGGTLEPVGYWPLDGNVNDEGGPNNGETNGSFVTSPIGQAVSLDGSQYVYVGWPTLESVGITNKMTIAAWVNQTTTSGAQAIFGRGAWAGSEGETSVVLYLGDGVPYARIGNGGQSVYIGSWGAVGSGWHHVAFIMDGTNAQMFIDGTASGGQYDISSFGNLNDVSGAGTSIGVVRNWWRNDIPFNGKIDDVRWYNRAITSTELAALASGQASLDQPTRFTASPMDVFQVFGVPLQFLRW